MMQKKYFLFLLGMAVFVFCSACSQSAADKQEDEATLNKQSVAAYEKLTTATDAEVVKVLGEGEIRNFESEIDGKTYRFLFSRTYESCLFDEGGKTEVRYHGPDEKSLLSDTVDTSTQQVASVIMSALLSKEKGEEVNSCLIEMFGSAASETQPFDGDGEYTGLWQGENAQYQLWYVGTEEYKDQCGVVVGIYPKDFIKDINHGIADTE